MGEVTWRAEPGAPPSYVAYAGMDVTWGFGAPPAELVSRLHLVATTASGAILVCRSVEGWRFLPGGTREPGETIAQLARRELREEAGAEIVGGWDGVGLDVVAAHEARSRLDRPYRPHLPYPRAFWAYGLCRAEVTGPPTNPDDGETVVEVMALPAADALAELEGSTDDPDLLHAGALRRLLERGVVPG